MIVFLLACVWVLLHFICYVAWVRHSGAAAGEGRVVRLHFISLGGLALVSGAAALALGYGRVLPLREILAGYCSALMLHAIYSMTFLELWSVSEGSILYGVLARIGAAGGGPLQMPKLEEMGAAKLGIRLAHLQDLGIVTVARDGICRLTMLGRVVHAVLVLLIALTNVRRGG